MASKLPGDTRPNRRVPRVFSLDFAKAELLYLPGTENQPENRLEKGFKIKFLRYRIYGKMSGLLSLYIRLCSKVRSGWLFSVKFFHNQIGDDV